MATTICDEIKKIHLVVKTPKPSSVQCRMFSNNPEQNPMTGNLIDPSSPNGAYRKLVDECKEIKKELNQLAEPKDAPYQPELNISEDKHKKILHLRLKNALRRALRPILNHTDSLENRIHYAKVIRTYLNNVQSCVRSSDTNPSNVALYEEKQGKLKEIIYFDRRIGSESVYGTAYLNTGRGLARILKFSIKIMSDKFTGEVDLLKKMSQLAETETTPNMPITYAVKKCVTPNDKTLRKNKAAIELMETGKYYVVLNELANGDTHDFFKFVYTNRDYESIITQMLFSLRSFHNLGYIHNDAHLGNFLWHKITPGGFWQYQYGNTTIYVPNTGYLMVLWDPGLAKKNYLPLYYPNIDYNRVIRLLMSIATIDTYRQKKMIPIPKEAMHPFIKILTLIHSTETGGIVHSSFMDLFIEILTSKTKKRFHHIYYKNDTENTLPHNSIIINKKPYKL